MIWDLVQLRDLHGVPIQAENAARPWLHRGRLGLVPSALPGGFPGLRAPDGGDQIAHAYGDNAARLLAAKQRYDTRWDDKRPDSLRPA